MICPKTRKQQKIETCRECLPYFQGVKGEFGSKAEVLCDFGKEAKAKVPQVEISKSGIDELWAGIEGLHRQLKETGDASLRSRYLNLLTTYGQCSEMDVAQMAELLQELEDVKEDIELAEDIGGEALFECYSRYELLSDKIWAVSGMEL